MLCLNAKIGYSAMFSNSCKFYFFTTIFKKMTSKEPMWDLGCCELLHRAPLPWMCGGDTPHASGMQIRQRLVDSKETMEAIHNVTYT